MRNKQKKIAIVYDWIDKWGGVERVLLHLSRLLPYADFYTSAVDLAGARWAEKLSVQTSFIQTLPLVIRKNRPLITPLYPIAFESFDFSGYDTVISITSSFAKGIITKPGTKHICYLLTPPRYLWSHMNDYFSPVEKVIATPLISHLQQWDMKAAKRPDMYISISRTVAKRAHAIYGVTSDIIFPPFDTAHWDEQKKHAEEGISLVPQKPYILWVGRMEQYKKPELICEAASQLPDRTFVFVGTGKLEAHLQRISPSNCLFTGFVTDGQLSRLYSHADALVMPQNEDFGYTSLEAQYHGCPVIAFHEGGACETVQGEVSGLFFNAQSVESLVAVLERFKQISYNLRRSTENHRQSIQSQFGSARFESQFIRYL